MDRDLDAAARALSAFDPLAALKRVALREDPRALALRGVAMAQLGEYGSARKLLTRAAQRIGKVDPRARARCLAALGEIALAQRDLTEAGRVLEMAESELEVCGDHLNAAFVRLQRVRQLVLLGEVEQAATLHRHVEVSELPPRLRSIAALIGADLAIRRLEPAAARASLARARLAARTVALPLLAEEIERSARELDAPVARVVEAGVERPVVLDEVAALLRSGKLVFDACRRNCRSGDASVSFAARPVLFTLGVALARAFPHDVSREALAEAAFGFHRLSESIRARLRVEIGRLRKALAGLAEVEPTGRGYRLRPRQSASVAALLPPAPGEASALLALLRAGEAWSTSALGAALGKSRRTIQRALVTLRDEGRVEVTGRGSAQRWIARPPEGFATSLLLVVRDGGW